MKSFRQIATLGFSFLMLSSPLQAANTALKGMIQSGDYSGALSVLSTGNALNNSNAMNVRAALLDKMGYYHAALAERVRAARRVHSSDLLERIGNHSLMLSRYYPAVGLMKHLPSNVQSRLPASFRVTLAAYNLEKGNINRAAYWLPTPSAILGLPLGPVKYKAILIASAIYFGNGKYREALELLGSEFPKIKNADLGSIRLERARLLFDMEQYGPALEELRFVSRSSPAWYDGQLVGAWASYHVKDYNLALGQLMNLHSPYLAKKFNPESYLLNAAVLYQLCYYESASRNLQNLKNIYTPLKNVIPQVRTIAANPIRFMGMLGAYMKGKTAAPGSIQQDQWDLIMDGVARQRKIADIDLGLSQLEKEQDEVEERLRSSRLQNLRSFYLKSYKEGRTEYYQTASEFARATLDNMSRDLNESLEGSLVVDVEINTRLRERLIKGSTAARKSIDFDKEVQKGYEFWPFEGEFWRDETGGYAFATSDVCERRN